MSWGYYDGVDPPHVLPVNAEGYAINGHLASAHCWCEPSEVRVVGRMHIVLLHHEDGPDEWRARRCARFQQLRVKKQ